jgi:NhaP-type Na+/H+ or K+/H+ antiporter
MPPISYVSLLVAALLIAAVSKRIHATIITVPMLCVVLGVAIGPLGFGFVNVRAENQLVEVIFELTLIMVLASDASRIKLRLLMADHSLPMRLLGIGLPLTMIGGTLAAVAIFPEFPFWEAVILAIILTPTDASLGQAVVTNRQVPLRIRQTLNVESGLNDGIAMPFLLLAISFALTDLGVEQPENWLLWGSRQIIFGVLTGAVVGYVGIKFTAWGLQSKWMSQDYGKIAAFLLPLIAYGVADMVGGNGFIAAFVLGATVGNVALTVSRRPLNEHMEVEVELLMVLTFLIFGAVLVEPMLSLIDGRTVLYALLSLTVVRMVPVFISMLGAKVKMATTWFLGWFGPRGVASILYTYVVLDAEHVSFESTIATIAILTVLLSIFAHGISAAPLAKRYGSYMNQADREVAEKTVVSAMPVRHERWVPSDPHRTE